MKNSILKAQSFPQSPNTVGNKIFDLHFEIGVNPPPLGGFYALTILGGNGVKFEAMGTTPAEALAKVALDMEASSMWAHIVQNPNASMYPFGSSGSAATPTGGQNQNAYNGPKQRPADLTTVSHPDCQAMCQSYEHFGNTRCKSICAQRNGL